MRVPLVGRHGVLHRRAAPMAKPLRKGMPQRRITGDELRYALRERESEAHFMAWVIEQAKLRGWAVYHTRNSEQSPDGFPDLILIRIYPSGAGRCIAAELKREKGRLALAQECWLDLFRRCGVFAAIWRPSQRAEVIRALEQKDPVAA